MRPGGVVLPVPAIGQCLRPGHLGESSVFRNSSRKRPLKDSEKPFCRGHPGSMYAVVVLLVLSMCLRVRAMNSGPLSDWKNAGAG